MDSALRGLGAKLSSIGLSQSALRLAEEMLVIGHTIGGH